jgi:hypothetical protein
MNKATYQRQYRAAHPGFNAAAVRRYESKIKLEILTHYGLSDHLKSGHT